MIPAELIGKVVPKTETNPLISAHQKIIKIYFWCICDHILYPCSFFSLIAAIDLAVYADTSISEVFCVCLFAISLV